jgi:two-component system, NtrC family, sensor kinase
MGFVITADPSAHLLSISHASPEFKDVLQPGVDLFSLLEKGSREKFTRFIQASWQQGRAKNWEIFFELDGEPHYLILNGVLLSDTLCIAAAKDNEELRLLSEKFCVAPDHAKSISRTAEDQPPSESLTSRPDQELFDDIGMLYAEMATLQRELTKKQVELEKSNQIINDYAANLEEMVEEKTRELSASEAKFRGIFENSSLGIAIADTAGSIITCNNALINIIGVSKEKICQFSMPELFFMDDLASFSTIMAGFVQNAFSNKEMEKNISQADHHDRWVKINIYSLQLDHAEQPNIIYIIEDITERKLNEQALLQAEKLTAVGKVAASLAHEINNPLQSIIGYLGLASESLDPDSSLNEYLDIAAQELDRIKNIVAELRAASRKPQVKEKKPADLDHVIHRVINLTRKKADEKHISLVYHPARRLPLVLMDSEQIHQVILNLLINSIEAICENGQVDLSVTPSQDKKMVNIIIADNGPGIKPELINNLFQPFFTTKKEGLGLGLHLSKAIIDAHHGQISVENGQMGGAVFTIALPFA